MRRFDAASGRWSEVRRELRDVKSMCRWYHWSPGVRRNGVNAENIWDVSRFTCAPALRFASPRAFRRQEHCNGIRIRSWPSWLLYCRPSIAESTRTRVSTATSWSPLLRDRCGEVARFANVCCGRSCLSRFGSRCNRAEKIEVTPLVSLSHVLAIERQISALILFAWLFPF